MPVGETAFLGAPTLCPQGPLNTGRVTVPQQRMRPGTSLDARTDHCFTNYAGI